jgi:hypothetical protein
MKELTGATLTWASSSSKPFSETLGDADIAAVLAEDQVLAVGQIGYAAIPQQSFSLSSKSMTGATGQPSQRRFNTMFNNDREVVTCSWDQLSPVVVSLLVVFLIVVRIQIIFLIFNAVVTSG